MRSIATVAGRNWNRATRSAWDGRWLSSSGDRKDGPSIQRGATEDAEETRRTPTELFVFCVVGGSALKGIAEEPPEPAAVVLSPGLSIQRGELPESFSLLRVFSAFSAAPR